ncbi:MAG: tripartite tricarboxylate transporter TctB family protein [Pseudomonadota bacterium]|nr:tripartite tricarboxylate transporter TctB family protein [Pseudomonadota bacterium]
MELVIAGAFMALAAVVMYDSARVGIGWAFDGPEAGYFPFYVGLIMFLASAVTFAVNLIGRNPDTSNFVERSGLRLVFKVLVPTAVYAAVMYFLGIYVASAIYICFFMMWLGKYSIRKAAPVAIVIPLILFWLFEIAFLIPLPKGPLEAAFGY